MRNGWVCGLAVGATLLGGCYITSPGAPPAPTDPPTRPPSEPDAGEPILPTPPAGGEGAAPVAGGTMALTSSGLTVAADVATDTLFVIDPASAEIVASLSLGDGVEPGRVVVDELGRAHVALRRTGELLSVDLAGPTVVDRRAVCPAPRGLAVDGDSLIVACAGGELVTLPASGGPATRTVVIEPDLRDVVVGAGVLYVSRFRSAELLTLDADGNVLARRVPEARTSELMRDPALPAQVMTPNVAYRIRALASGDVAMLHQRSVSTPIEVDRDGYGGGECRTGVVESAISIFPAGGGAPTSSGALTEVGLPVDLAVTPDGGFVVAAAGIGQRLIFPSVHRYTSAELDQPCVFGEAWDESPAVAVEVAPDGGVVALHHDSTQLLSLGGAGVHRSVTHPAPAGRNRGYVLFHTQTISGVACASCHPEGAEDGHVWDFQPTGERRTQTLLGGVLATAPFHWSGDQPDMNAIMTATFSERMQGFFENPTEDVVAISEYLDRQPLPAGSVHDAAAVARGQALFEGAAGCADCHSGHALTNDETMDVGTGGAFQVPSLRGVGLRAPYFHAGCAPTLEDAVAGSCGTRHGEAGALLAEPERADLVAYLRAL